MKHVHIMLWLEVTFLGNLTPARTQQTTQPSVSQWVLLRLLCRNPLTAQPCWILMVHHIISKSHAAVPMVVVWMEILCCVSAAITVAHPLQAT